MFTRDLEECRDVRACTAKVSCVEGPATLMMDEGMMDVFFDFINSASIAEHNSFATKAVNPRPVLPGPDRWHSL